MTMYAVLCAVLVALHLASHVNADVCRADVCFLVDRSGSNDEWDQIKQLMIDFVNNRVIGPDNTQVGMVQFGSFADLTFDLDDHPTTASLVSAIGAITQANDGTDLAEGIRFAKEHCFGPGTGDRKDARDIIIVISDGKSCYSTALAAADEAREADFTVLAIGVDDPKIKVIRAVAGGSTGAMAAGNYTTIETELSVKYQKLCKSECAVDMCFVVDQSDNITPQQFSDVKGFIKDFLSELDIHCSMTHVGLVQFTNVGELVFGLKDHTNKPDLLAAVDNMTRAGGAAKLTSGIKTAREKCFAPGAGVRPYEPQIMVVISDGKFHGKNAAIKHADAARADGITVISVGVGDNKGKYKEDTMLALAGGLQENTYSGYCPCTTGDCTCTWSRTLSDFTITFFKTWCNKVICSATFEEDLQTLEGNTKALADNKYILIRYDPPSPCKFRITWDLRLSSNKYPSMTIDTGIHPNNTGKYFRHIDFLRQPNLTDSPSQRGWKCKRPEKSQCPLASKWPSVPWYPYLVQIMNKTPYARIMEVEKNKRYDVAISYADMMDRCPGDDNPDYWMSYFFNPEGGLPTMTMALDKDFYNKHKAEISGLCAS